MTSRYLYSGLLALFLISTAFLSISILDRSSSKFLQQLLGQLPEIGERIAVKALTDVQWDSACVFFTADDSQKSDSINAYIKAKAIQGYGPLVYLKATNFGRNYKVAILLLDESKYVDVIYMRQPFILVGTERYYWGVQISGKYCKSSDDMFLEAIKSKETNLIVIK